MRALKFEAAVLVNVIVNAANTLKVNEKRIKIVITGEQNEQEIKLKATFAAINSTWAATKRTPEKNSGLYGI